MGLLATRGRDKASVSREIAKTDEGCAGVIKADHGRRERGRNVCQNGSGINRGNIRADGDEVEGSWGRLTKKINNEAWGYQG